MEETQAPPVEETPAPAAQAAEPHSTIDDTGEIEIELDPSILVTSVRPPAGPEIIEEPQAQAQEPEPSVTAPAPAAPSHVVPAAPSHVVPAPAAAGLVKPTPVAAPRASAAAVTSAPVAAAPVTPAPVSPAPTPPAGAQPAPPTRPASLAPPASPAEDAQEDAQTNTPQQSPEGAFELRARRPRVELAWRIGAGALVLLLLLQIVNHYRDALAANPALHGPLSAVYAALGVKLAPHWDIHAYDVRQLGASVAAAAAGQIVVRASVKNSASRAQPLPLLRVTLQDRFGNRIAARDVPPGDYLPSSVARNSLLAAGSRVDATMVFVDPGPQAVGFEIDACLRQRNGAVACAHGP
jgi:hypothetical protein